MNRKTGTTSAFALALVLAAPAVSATDLVYGGFQRHGGIMLPADWSEYAASPAGAQEDPTTARLVYGSFRSGPQGHLLPADPPATAASSGGDAARAPALAGTELLFGSFVRRDGIAVPAAGTRGSAAEETTATESLVSRGR